MSKHKNPDFIVYRDIGPQVSRRSYMSDSEGGHSKVNTKKLLYYIYVSEFASNFISIPTNNLTDSSAVVASSYLAGRATLYNGRTNLPDGTCSASFLNMQTDTVFSDIANYIASDGGLIITWFTPTTLLNLEVDSVINGMVTECIVQCTTKVGKSRFYGKKYNMVVSSSSGKIFFNLKRIRG
ncbi:MAG: hypothetical protein ACYCOU_04550 [Sulfobacillus sp.]